MRARTKKLLLAGISVLVTLLFAELALRIQGIGAVSRGSPWFRLSLLSSMSAFVTDEPASPNGALFPHRNTFWIGISVSQKEER